MQKGWQKAADDAGIQIAILGIPPVTNFVIQHDNPLALQTLFIQEMLRRGFLASDRFYPTLAHTDSDVADYLQAVAEAFAIVAKANASGTPEKFLEGPVKMAGFKRLN